MDLVVLRRIVAELDEQLSGARIGPTFAVPPYHLALVVGTRSEPRLWFSAAPEEPHLYLRPGPHPTPERPPGFAMAVRKRARGRRIESIRLLDDDRVAELRWSGDGARLVFELMPQRATALLVGDDDRVVAVWNPRRGRPGVGRLYTAPARSERRVWSELGISDWREIESAGDPRAMARNLVRTVDRATRLIALEAIAARESGVPLREAVGRELERADTEPTAAIAYSEPSSLAPYPLAHTSAPGRSFGSLLKAAAWYYCQQAERRQLALTRREVRARIRARRQRLQRARDRILDSAPPEGSVTRLRQDADLLLAHPDAETSGPQVIVPDDYGDGRQRRVEVDPSLDRVSNAQKLYRRAQRIERKLEHDRRRLAQLLKSLDALTQLDQFAEQEADLADRTELLRRAAGLELGVRDIRLREPETAAPAAGAPATGARETEAAETRPPEPAPAHDPGLPAGVRRLVSPVGEIILVGSNARANDRLTHHIAARNDWWLHAAGPGSHVVLRNPHGDEQPDRGALQQAAAIAAWFSKARQATKVEVHWTQVRHVRRVRGGAPGQALLREHAALLVEPRSPEQLWQHGPDGD